MLVAVEIEMCTSARWRNDIYNDSDFLAREFDRESVNAYIIYVIMP